MFRLRHKETGEWLGGMHDEQPFTVESKMLAHIYEPEKRDFFLNDPDYEIVPLAEDEIMAARGEGVAPRLPGF